MRLVARRLLAAVIRRTQPPPISLREMVARLNADLDTEFERMEAELTTRGEELAERAWRRAVAA